MSYESATVLPLGLSTASCALFQKDQLALQLPSMSPNPTGRTVLVWGGSTSVGSCAIQLAVAAGYEVITTASRKNFAYVKQLGAGQVFDYSSETVVQDLIKAFRGKTLAGALAIGAGSAEACLDVVHACDGNRFVAMATFPVSFDTLAKGANPRLHVLRQLPRVLAFFLSLKWKSWTRAIRTNFIFGSSLIGNEVSRAVYVDFLPAALAEGKIVAAPEPQVIGRGLDLVQAGMDLQKKGVSASKIVVSL